MALNNLKGLSDLAKAAQGRKGKEVMTVSVNEVESKTQVRKRFRNIAELAITFLTEGQQSPIIVSPKNSGGKYVIQKGERRWRACRHAGILTIDIIVNEKTQSELDGTAGELIENIQRDDLTCLEVAEAMNKFIQSGWKQKDIAERIGKNLSYISTHLSLLKMPDCVRELYDNEVCSDTETLNNLRLMFDINEERCRSACALVMEDGITRKQSRELLNDAKSIEEERGKCIQSKVKKVDDNGLSDEISYENKPPLIDIKNINFEANQRQINAEIESKKMRLTDWKSVSPDNLIFSVNLTINGETKRGIIMTDRVATNPEIVWVKILDEKGKGKLISVPTSDIKLISVEG